jgi:hypothetical protein
VVKPFFAVAAFELQRRQSKKRNYSG